MKKNFYLIILLITVSFTVHAQSKSIDLKKKFNFYTPLSSTLKFRKIYTAINIKLRKLSVQHIKLSTSSYYVTIQSDEKTTTLKFIKE